VAQNDLSCADMLLVRPLSLPPRLLLLPPQPVLLLYAIFVIKK